MEKYVKENSLKLKVIQRKFLSFFIFQIAIEMYLYNTIKYNIYFNALNYDISTTNPLGLNTSIIISNKDKNSFLKMCLIRTNGYNK